MAGGAIQNRGARSRRPSSTVEAYLAAALGLFSDAAFAGGQPAVINADGRRAEDVIAAVRAQGLALLLKSDFAGRSFVSSRPRPMGFARRLHIEHGGRTRRGLGCSLTRHLPGIRMPWWRRSSRFPPGNPVNRTLAAPTSISQQWRQGPARDRGREGRQAARGRLCA